MSEYTPPTGIMKLEGYFKCNLIPCLLTPQLLAEGLCARHGPLKIDAARDPLVRLIGYKRVRAGCYRTPSPSGQWYGSRRWRNDNSTMDQHCRRDHTCDHCIAPVEGIPLNRIPANLLHLECALQDSYEILPFNAR